MKFTKNNVAYIDGANLHNGVERLPWNFDYGRFRVWLSEKYDVDRAYLFLGLIPKYNNLYIHLKNKGYILIFKKVIYDNEGKAKGNCDADIIVSAMENVYESKFDKVVLVSSDGDYAPLVKFLLRKQKMLSIISPNKTERCSVLLKRINVKIAYITDQQGILETINEKAPDEDKTS
ncbi:MAG: NYN domain-containing protein [Candidatus Paceibacterota bacterium]